MGGEVSACDGWAGMEKAEANDVDVCVASAHVARARFTHGSHTWGPRDTMSFDTGADTMYTHSSTRPISSESLSKSRPRPSLDFAGRVGSRFGFRASRGSRSQCAVAMRRPPQLLRVRVAAPAAGTPACRSERTRTTRRPPKSTQISIGECISLGGSGILCFIVLQGRRHRAGNRREP